MASAVLGKVSPTPKGEYVSTQDYDRLDVVTYEGYPYLAKSNVPSGNLPTDELYWMPLLTDLDFAPGGYGLGGSGKLLTSTENLDNITANGWYWWYDSRPTGALYNYCYMRVDSGEKSSKEYVTQTIKRSGGLGTIVRHNESGEWVEEWVNPPMTLGVEYRTTERWNGAVVYVKMLDCGELSSTDQKLVTFASETTASAFQLYGRAYRSGGNMITLPYGEAILISGDNNRVLIHTKGVSSGWYAYVGVKYTK
jgi:hypothetical protein